MFKVIDNFLEPYVADRIKFILSSTEFPWYYHNHIAYKSNTFEQSKLVGEEDGLDRYQFVHSFKSNVLGTSSIWFDQSTLPIIDKLKVSFSQVIRAKVNLSLYTGKPYASAFHIDNAEPHKVALYYVNTNNGYTEFESGEKVSCIKNRIVLFDGTIKHRAIKQTDTKTRIAININYEMPNE
jgi:hypothetical protein